MSPWLPGVLSAALILGLLGGIHLLLVRIPAEPLGECQFGGQLVPTASQQRTDSLAGPLDNSGAMGEFMPLTTDVSWRFGFGLATRADPARWAPVLGAGWYLDWSAAAGPSDRAVEHWPMVRVAPGCTRPAPEEAARLARENPGQTWIIGNEPDVIWQDNLTPERYAEAYHAYDAAIRHADPSARLAVAGVAQPTPLRLAYLDRVLEAYQAAYGRPMAVDVWTVHNFVLREERGSWGAEIPPGFEEVRTGRPYDVVDHARLDLFEEQLREFRRWMARHGYRDTPLALTEFGILMPSEYGFPTEAVADYLQATVGLLMQLHDRASGYPADGNLLVQRWAWFSLSDAQFPTGNLANLDTGRLTVLGQSYRRSVERWASGH